MKKMLGFVCMLLMLSASVFAQEAEAESEAPPAQYAPPRASVNVALGTLDIHGMLLTGVVAEKEEGGRTLINQPDMSAGYPADTNGAFDLATGKWGGGIPYDGNLRLGARNPLFERNLAALLFDWKINENFGAVVDLRAVGYGINQLNYTTTNVSDDVFTVQYAFGWVKTDLFKLSVGRIQEQTLVFQDQIWLPKGFPGVESTASVTFDEDHFSTRLELTPIEGLNFGVQYFFIDGNKDIGEYDAWKEIGIGAQYNRGTFGVAGAIRFDSPVDPIGRHDFKTYLDSYYGSWSALSQGTWANFLGGPNFKHSTEAYAEDFDKGGFAYLGFGVNPIPNLTILGFGEFRGFTAFKEFGYGKFIELVKYDKLLNGRLTVGLELNQEFYGSDVYVDEMVNSPFLKFTPSITYAIIPGVFLPMLSAQLNFSYGYCKDVVDAYINIDPALSFSLGVYTIDLKYTFNYEGYAESTGLDPRTKHKVALGLTVFF
jgi:hypothetical protein